MAGAFLVAGSGLLVPVVPASADYGGSTDSGAQIWNGTTWVNTASSVIATDGSGRYKDRILWLNWGALSAANPQVGDDLSSFTGSTSRVVRSWQRVGPATRLEVTCRLYNVVRVSGSAQLRAYRPGTSNPGYYWDGLSMLYRTGGTRPGTTPLSVGGTVATDGTLVNAVTTTGTGGFTFSVSCDEAETGYGSAGLGMRLASYADGTFSGTPVATTAVPLAGLVFADAESTKYDGTQFEYTRATADSTTASWRVIDAYVGCNIVQYNAAMATVNSRPRLSFQTSTNECGTGSNTNTTPFSTTAVAVATGAKKLDVELTMPSGQGAAAFGVVVGPDYGDAPASYGTPAAIVQPTWAGTGLATGTTTPVTTVTNGTAALSPTVLRSMTAPAVRLGANAFANREWLYDATASLDAGWSVPSTTNLAGVPSTGPSSSLLTPDEDAIAAPAPVVYTRGVTTSYTLPGVTCTNGAFVQGWVDWDRSGVFDADEGSAVATCAAGTASLVFTIPADVPDGVAVGGDLTFLRLRTAAVQAQLGPTSIVAAGEVEDWPIRLQVPKLQVTKTANVTAIPAAGGVVTYSVVATNVGNGDYTAPAPAYVYDYYAAAADDATLGAVTSNPSGVTNSAANSLLTWSGALPVGASVTVAIPMTVRAAPGDLVMTNTARVSSSSLATAGAQAACSAVELTALTCSTHVLYRVGVTATKTGYLASDTTFTTPVASGTALTPGTAIVWRYVVTNTGSAALTNVVLTDTATDTATTIAGTTSATTHPTISCPHTAGDGLPDITPGSSVTIPSLAPSASRTCTASGTIGVS